MNRLDNVLVIVANGEVHVIDAEPVNQVVDTTGAGDLYAAGFLYGYTRGLDLGLCGRIAAICAADRRLRPRRGSREWHIEWSIDSVRGAS